MTTTVSPELSPIPRHRLRTVAVGAAALLIGLTAGNLLDDDAGSSTVGNAPSAPVEATEAPTAANASAGSVSVSSDRPTTADAAERHALNEQARREEACSSGTTSADAAERCFLLLEPARG